jgi:FkbM family methyltransferase
MRSSAHADLIASSDAAKRMARCAKVWRPNGEDYGDRRMMPTDQALGRPLSYAQNMEDYHLDVAFGGAPQGRYIDIGGGHPVAGSVSFWFYQRGWSGIVVEPQPALAALHRRLRPRDTLVEAVIGRSSGETDFFKIDRLHGLSTTVRANAEAAGVHGVGFETVTLPSISLAELCRTHAIDSIDFLKIDVEGAERDVLEGADWSRWRPRIVVVEAVTPLTNAPAWSDWEPLLLENNYRFALFDTLNRFYVAAECADILERMPHDRAPWDVVTHMYEIGRAPENSNHPDFALAEELARGFWASLPLLDDKTLAMLLARARDCKGAERQALDEYVRSEAFLAALGRIACTYDGGHVP